MMPPTTIDGTDITGATIDGIEVTEITVDGDKVFGTLPVAYSNLIGWWPFDSAEYGGSNADDVTAIIGGSGDDTAYDGSVTGANYQGSSGVVDINAGPNSGRFAFPGTDDRIDIQDDPGLRALNPFTATLWARFDKVGSASGNTADIRGMFYKELQAFASNVDAEWEIANDNFSTASIRFKIVNAPQNNQRSVNIPHTLVNTSDVFHIAASYNGGDLKIYLDGTLIDSDTAPFTSIASTNQDLHIAGTNPAQATDSRDFDGELDDIRLYNTELSQSQIEQIYDNTKPASKP